MLGLSKHRPSLRVQCLTTEEKRQSFDKLRTSGVKGCVSAELTLRPDYSVVVSTTSASGPFFLIDSIAFLALALLL